MNMTDKDFQIEYTEADLDEMRRADYAEDELPDVGAHTFRRARHITTRREQKLKVTLFLDADVVDYFTERAEHADNDEKTSYQAQINKELRRLMEAEETAAASDDKFFTSPQDVLNDVAFLRALKEKLAHV